MIFNKACSVADKRENVSKYLQHVPSDLPEGVGDDEKNGAV
jgi:hypothetical protein